MTRIIIYVYAFLGKKANPFTSLEILGTQNICYA